MGVRALEVVPQCIGALYFFYFSDSLSLFDYSTDISLPRTFLARSALLLVSLLVCILDIARYDQSFWFLTYVLLSLSL